MSRDSYKRAFAVLVVVGVVVPTSPAVNAAITVHNNQADFLLENPTSQFVEFPAVTADSGVFVFDDGTLQGEFGAPLLWGTLPLAPINPRPSTPWATVSGEDDFQWDFTIPVRAMAFDLITNSTSQESVLFFDTADQLIQILDIDAVATPNTALFLGFSSTTPISRVLLNTAGGGSQNVGIDSFFFAVVPEPTPLSLLVIGGLAMLGRRRRRRTQTVV